jgi:hypothetical protein
MCGVPIQGINVHAVECVRLGVQECKAPASPFPQTVPQLDQNAPTVNHRNATTNDVTYYASRSAIQCATHYVIGYVTDYSR